MITTVTTSTVTTIATMGLAVTLSVVAGVSLLFFLTTKELIGASPYLKFRLAAKYLNVAILPMLVVLAVIVGVKVAEMLA